VLYLTARRAESIYRDRKPTLEIAADGRPWSFDGDNAFFPLLSEANCIRLVYHFDPFSCWPTTRAPARRS
jgi:hypothetical protein